MLLSRQGGSHTESSHKPTKMKFFFNKTEKPPTSGSERETEKDIMPSKIEDGPTIANTSTIDPELEKRVRRKLDMNLIPLVSALYLCMSSTQHVYYTIYLTDTSYSGLSRPLKHRQRAHCRHGSRPALQIRRLRLAPDHLLHLLHLLRLLGHHVESRAPALLGHAVRLHMGSRLDRASSSELMGRDDGAQVHHGHV